jgi:hypothetical protein
MYVASAIAASPRMLPVMTARNGGDIDERAGARTPSKGEGEAPLVARYPMIAFSFNMDASRLVLLYRDPSTGQTVDQIPSETALKHYEEAQKKEDKRKKLEVIVGGAAKDAATRTDAFGPSVTASPATPAAVSGTTAGRGEGTTAASGGAAPVSASSATTSASGTAPRVNVVI